MQLEGISFGVLLYSRVTFITMHVSKLVEKMLTIFSQSKGKTDDG